MERHSCFIDEETGGETVTNEELLKLDCDVLVPVAIESQITAQNAGELRHGTVTPAVNSGHQNSIHAAHFSR
jgi:glutamate dehydrogenase/leucine dehydrogenase